MVLVGSQRFSKVFNGSHRFSIVLSGPGRFSKVPKESLHMGTPSANILWEATNKTGMPHLHFLGPPSVSCY